MDRNQSSDLGEQQAEGNLGNERVRNRSTEGSSRQRSRDRERPDEPSSYEPDRTSEERTDGSER
jgi:hypothetical protein